MVERIKSRGNSILALSSDTTVKLRIPEDLGHWVFVEGAVFHSFVRSTKS